MKREDIQAKVLRGKESESVKELKESILSDGKCDEVDGEARPCRNCLS